MNEEQLEHFRQLLLSWRADLVNEVTKTVGHMKDEAANFLTQQIEQRKRKNLASSYAHAIVSAS